MLMQAKLIQAVDLAPGVRHFSFEVEDGQPLHFVPGQFVSLKHVLQGEEYTRAYSVASAPDGSRFDLCLNLVPGGLFSAYLFALKPGDRVEFTPPLGFFTLRNTDRDILLVGTGTGIAPFRSMLASHIARLKKPVTLLFGTRYEGSILYRSEFEELERAHPHFQFWPTLTRPHAEWKDRTGRVQSHLDEALGGRTDLDVYLCGLKEMVDDMRRQLKARGFDRRRIVYEKYD